MRALLTVMLAVARYVRCPSHSKAPAATVTSTALIAFR